MTKEQALKVLEKCNFEFSNLTQLKNAYYYEISEGFYTTFEVWLYKDSFEIRLFDSYYGKPFCLFEDYYTNITLGYFEEVFKKCLKIYKLAISL